MAPSPTSPPPAGRDLLHVQLSPMLLVGLISAAITTVAVVVTAVLAARVGPPPGFQRGDAPPPPPPEATALLIAIALCVVAWVIAIVAYARDYLVRRLVAAEERLTALAIDYGEGRETEGYLKGMRAANGERRGLRPVPPDPKPPPT